MIRDEIGGLCQILHVDLVEICRPGAPAVHAFAVQSPDPRFMIGKPHMIFVEMRTENEIHETDTLVQQIKEAMTEQQQGSSQILDALSDMNESTENN